MYKRQYIPHSVHAEIPDILQIPFRSEYLPHFLEKYDAEYIHTDFVSTFSENILLFHIPSIKDVYKRQALLFQYLKQCLRYNRYHMGMLMTVYTKLLQVQF